MDRTRNGASRGNPTRGLLIRAPYVDRILDGRKTWEVRGSRTAVRGLIALLQSGSGLIVGTCELVDVKGPLSLKELRRNARKAGCRPSDFAELPYPLTYAWVLHHAKRHRRRPYLHPKGAVIWVRLEDAEK